ncbi:MAG: aspartate aminotransferase family protein [Rhodospirillaceae bacterium]|jgi:2,2-dialkylglycine decarboxylase (pyruvate)|nr:aspartate aminotransferase family protein [Rhodospirillaceae bacterium]MBT5245642.1 aspartate aminotransferase family protein [Rhodospirillaceae bacterium]MBT5562352.1 aspartate aminotransferase family protein [Rhodospirillaceae bacterium]MBT6241580.1 aspartate aminotransferase family protein [Rhodospirillaceae bacterium]MBT7138801.1 aspartate aminotransferase family protein [Rhodospirillaceae bacterium]
MPEAQEAILSAPPFEKHLLHYGRDFLKELIVRAEGSYFFTEAGRAILDFSSGQMCATIGHNHPKIVEALAKAGQTVIHLDSTMLSPDVISLVDTLADLLPHQLSKVQLLNTGGEANESALRLAKIATGRFEIIGMAGSWHGTTTGAASTTYAHGRKKYGPVMPGSLAIPSPNCYRCPIRHCADQCDMTCLDVGFEMIDATSVGEEAAVIVEPIQSAGGIIVPPQGYLGRLRELCDQRGILLIYDEAQTGLGRTGNLFGFEREGIVPDILTLSKTLGGGLPLSAVIASKAVATAARENGFSHYTSHASDPLTATVGLAVVDVIISEKLTERSAKIGQYLKERLCELQQRHEAIGDVRGHGLLLGVEIVADRTTKEPGHELIKSLTERCFELGLNINRVGGLHCVWRFAPPLTITKKEIDQAIDILDQAFTEIPD